MSKRRIPRTEEIVNRRELVRRHPTILTEHRVRWALRHRATNGLDAAVYESRSGELLIHEPVFIGWFLGAKVKTQILLGRRREEHIDAHDA